MNKPNNLFIEQRMNISPETIKQFCQQWKIEELAAFGSVIREDFNSDSDIDLLVSFTPDATITLFDLEKMETQLQTLLKRKVDIVSKRAIEQSLNPIRRQNILNNTEVIYVTK